MWNKPKNAASGTDFDSAAAKVTATEMPPNAGGALGPDTPEEQEEHFSIREEWAEGAARLCFVPPARLIHPAYALTDEEAEAIGPKMQVFLQAVADKYAPALLTRIANKYPEFFDLTAALGVLYYHKYKFVSRLMAQEVEERARKQAEEKAASNVIDIPISSGDGGDGGPRAN